jgi:hypothetical protein
MRQKFYSLDRKIFEQTVGITKINSHHYKNIEKENKKILSESFIDSMSKEMREKLIKRLQNRIDTCKIEKYNKGLKQ